ncbi:MAG TPA: peptide chain release factor 1 [Dehalococcoidia bacterium]|nr:peptide chain release factor 1 [Dehalococcoidia bacterium]
MWEKLETLERRYQDILEEMARLGLTADYERLQALAKERAALADIAELYAHYKRAGRALEEAQAILREDGDSEMVALAADEVRTLTLRQRELEAKLKEALLPRDPKDEKDVIIEVRAGTGGREAALFAADLFRMYARYAERQGWAVDILSSSESDLNGFKEIIFEMKGKGVYSRLKYERGVHRVQRVPVTETGGRIHTSTATVAVLPEAKEVDVHIDEDDLRIDVFHAGGHGGQNVNKVATAVRITHLPTGMVVVCQDERSQFRNRQKALAVLRARLLDMEQRRQQEEEAEARRAQVGTGERAEKVRTYNFPQNRITDHRIGLTLHNLPAALDGDLDPVIEPLAAEERARRLEDQPR